MSTSVVEPIVEHKIEPEIAGVPPRNVRLPIGTVVLLLVAMLMFAMLVYGGIRSIFEAGKLAALGAAGTNVTAHVVAVQNIGPLAPGDTVHQLSFTYRFDTPVGPGVPIQTTVAQTAAQSLPDRALTQQKNSGKRIVPKLFAVGDPLNFRKVSWFGRTIVHPWSPAPIGTGLFLLGAGALVVGVSSVFLVKVARWGSRRYHLLRNGSARVGTITHKYTSNDESPKFFVRYGFPGGDGEGGVEREEQCSSAQWRSLEIGMPVTVLVDPNDPDLFGLYKLVRAE